MKRIFQAFVFAVLSVVPATAQQTPGVFESYEDLRDRLDPLIETLEFSELMGLFVEVPATERQNMMATEVQMRGMLPNPLSLSDRVRAQDFENGYRQELIAFSDGGTGYLFVRLVLHDRADGRLVAIRFAANTNIDALLALF